MDRKLADSDIKAIVDELERRATQRFQLNVGRGVIGIVWRIALYFMIWIAAYGAAGGFNRFFK